MPLKCIIPAEATNCHRPDKRLICGIWNCYCYRVFQLSVCPAVCPVTLCAAALRILCPFIICHVVNLPPALIVLLLLLLLLPLLWVLGVNVTVDSVSAPAYQLPAMRLPHPFGLSTFCNDPQRKHFKQFLSPARLHLWLYTYYVLYMGNRNLVSFSCCLIVEYPSLKACCQKGVWHNGRCGNFTIISLYICLFC